MKTLGCSSVPRMCRIIIIIWCGVCIAGCGRSGDERAAEADKQGILAQMLFNQRLYTKSLETITQAILTNGELNRDSALGENHLVEAHCQRQLGRYDESKNSFKLALQSFRLTGDQKLERRGRIALAELYFELQDIPSALSLASDAAAEARIFLDTTNLLHALSLIADVHHHQRKFDQEITFRNDLLGVGRTLLGARISEELSALIRAYAELGRLDLASETFNRLVAYEASGRDSSGLASAYYTWGRSQMRLGYADSALRSFSQALSMLSRKSTRRLQTNILTALGNLSYQASHYDDARRYYGEAQRLAREENNILQEPLLGAMVIACDWKAAGEHGSSNQLPELIRRCSGVKSACAQNGFLSAEAFITFVRGRIEEQLPSPEDSSKSYSEAITLSSQTTLPTADDDPVFEVIDVFMKGEKSDWFTPLLRFYCTSGNAARAFELAEQKKLIEVSKFFSHLSISTENGAVNEALLALKLKRRTLELLQRDILEEFAAGRERNMERIESLGTLFKAGIADAEVTSRSLGDVAFRWLVDSRGMTMQTVRDSLPAGSALLTFLPLNDAVYLMVVRPDTTIVRKTNVAGTSVLPLVREYCRLIGDHRLTARAAGFDDVSAIRRVNELSTVLGAMLLDPVLPLLTEIEQLYIVPPDEFGWLPVHTLRIGNGQSKALGERFSISYLPTAAALFFPHQKELPVSDVVGLGHPGRTQWDVEYELKDIRGFYEKARMFFDASATLQHLDTLHIDVLHLAAEFNLDTEIPDESMMTVSDGKTPFGVRGVSLGQMLGMVTPQTLVLSNVSPTPGGLSLYAPLIFLANGSKSVIATMWQGDRKTKKYFGEVFYTNLLGGIPASTAFHTATVTMAKSEEYGRLYRWGLYFRFGK